MANYNTTASVTVTMNGRQAEQVLNALEKKANDLRKAIDKESNSANPNANKIKQLQKELTRTEKTMKDMTSTAASMEQTFRNLDKATPKELRKALREMERQLNNTERGSKAWNLQVEKIRAVRAQLAQVNSQMREQETSAERCLNWFNKWQTAILGITAAITGAVMAARSAVNKYAEMEEAMAETQKFTPLSADGVRDLNEEFKKMDTRKSREELNAYAVEAGKLGKQAKEDILGYVKVAEITNVALSDLGEGATQSIAKLSNIFKIEDQYGTYNSMMKIGSTINVLSQNCTASKPYLVEFTNRMASVGNLAHVAISDIIGMGAVLDSNAQKVEASATAISQVLTRMYRDPAKYAKVAGLDVQKFTKLIKEDANEAMLQFLEALNKAGGMENLAPMFKDLGENGARAISALATMANKIDDVRRQQQNASQAFEQGTSMLREYNIFNNTVQAGIDKAKNKVTELSIELGEKLSPIMKHVYTSGSLMLRLLLVLVNAVTANAKTIAYLSLAIAGYTLVLKKNLIMETAHSLLMKGKAAWVKAVTVAQTLYNVAMGNTNTATLRAVASSQALRAVVTATPWGLVAAAVAALAGWLVNLAMKQREAKKAAEEHRKELEAKKKSYSDISKAVGDATVNEMTQLNKLYRVAKSENQTRELRLKAMQKLMSLYPEIFKNMTAEQWLAKGISNEYLKIRDSIREAAKARAAFDLITQNEQEMHNLQLKKEELYEVHNNLRLQIADIDEQLSKEVNPEDKKNMTSQKKMQIRDKNKKLREKRQQLWQQLKENTTELNETISLYNSAFHSNEKMADKASKYINETIVSEEIETPDYTPTDTGTDNVVETLKKQFSDRLSAIQEERQKKEIDIEIKFLTGAIDYVERQRKIDQAQADYIDTVSELYETHFNAANPGKSYLEEREYRQLRLEVIQSVDKERTRIVTNSKTKLDNQKSDDLAELEFDYKRGQQSLSDEIAYLTKKLGIERDYFEKLKNLYPAGSELREQAERDWEKKKTDSEREIRAKFLDAAKSIREQQEKSWLKQLEEARQVIDLLLEAKQITKEEADRARKSAEREARQKSGAVPERNKKEQRAEQEAEKQRLLADAKAALDAGLISLDEYNRRVAEIQRNAAKSMKDVFSGVSDDWVQQFMSMYDGWKELIDAIKNGSDDIVSKTGAALQSTAAVFATAVGYIQQMQEAQTEIRVKKTEEYYTREIELAEGNYFRTRQLEKQRDSDLSAIKRAQAKKTMNLQVAQALAQTAANAISAYGAGLQVGGLAGLILAPIAAGIAVAAGMAQVANIKKQQEVQEATGYEVGGYTAPGPKKKVAGVVHAGEWVAPADMVADPVTGSMISYLEGIRKGNRVATIRPADVDYRLTAAMRSNAAQSAIAPAATIVANPAASGDDRQLSRTLSRLADRLDEPFVTYNTVTGPNGMRNALDRYDRLIANKSPKPGKLA